MELIDLVNSVIIFLSQMILLRWLTFLIDPWLWLSHSCSVGCISFSDTSICSTMSFPPVGNSNHVGVSVSIDFPINSKQDAPSHRIAYDYSCADWDVFLIIWEMFHFKISSNSVLLLLLVNFVSGFRLELMYIFLIVSIRSNLTHLHGFQQLVLLP